MDGRCKLSTLRKCAHSSRITANVSSAGTSTCIQSAPTNLRGIGDDDARRVLGYGTLERSFVRCTNCLIIVAAVVATFYLVSIAPNVRQCRCRLNVGARPRDNIGVYTSLSTAAKLLYLNYR